MQVLTGTKRELTLMQWNEQLEKAQIKEVIAFMDANNIK